MAEQGSGTEAERQAGGRPVEEMSFEEALEELERIVQMLEREPPDLERAIAAYERGTLLRKHCERKLHEAQLRVEKLTFDGEGTPRTEPFEPQ